MVRLTEEMVVARTRISDLTAVKKLNCWGTELTDVSILRDLKKVEVLSLSVNNIDTLADFQYCLNLQDLFVRKNNIKDLNEVCYLQNLPNLRNLWLGENPCSEREGYRLAVLRALPNLEKLDDKIVSTEEVQNALARGRILVHPLDMDASPTCSDTPSPQELVAEYIDEGEIDQRRRYSCSIDQQQHQQHQQQQQQGYATRGNHRSTEDYQETDRRNANWNASPNFQHNYPQNNHYSYENGTSRGDNNADAALTRSESRSILDNLTPTTNTLGIFKEYDDQALAGETERTRRRRRHSSSNGEDTYEDNPRRAAFPHNDAGENEASSQRSNLSQIESASTNLVSPRTSYPPVEYSDERRSGERRDASYEHQHDDRRLNLLESEDSMRRSSTAPAYHHHTPVDRDEAASRDREMATAAAAAAQGWVRHSEKDKCRFHYHRRPVTRNSNILSAVLCLVKELDYPSLEVVEMAVRNRMDELEE